MSAEKTNNQRNEMNVEIDAEIKGIVEQVWPNVRRRLAAETEERVFEAARQAMVSGISEVVTAWVASELAPQIKEQLIGEKAALRDVAMEAGAKIKDAIVVAMVEQLNEKLKNSWTRKKILDGLFE